MTWYECIDDNKSGHPHAMLHNVESVKKIGAWPVSKNIANDSHVRTVSYKGLFYASHVITKTDQACPCWRAPSPPWH